MASIYDWSTTPADNDDADSGINFVENQAPSTVNNSTRQMMARNAEFIDDIGGVADSTGTGNAYEVTIQSAITAYARGNIVTFRADKTNTGPSTLKLNALTAVALNVTDTQALTAGEIKQNGMYAAYYDGTRFLLLNPGAGTVTVDNLEAGVVGRLLQPGFVIPWFTDTVPNDAWVFAEGQPISRTTYAPLFNQWGTRFGAGDGSATFNVIDLRGEFLRGLDTTATNDPDVASRTDRGDGTTGANVGTKQGGDFLSHTHTGTTDGHDHSYDRAGTGGNAQAGGLSGPLVQGATTGTSTDTFTSDATGGNETRPRNIATRYIILANPALAADALNLSGLSGFGLTFDTSTTMADPGVGELRLNNATLSSVTAIAIDDQSSDTGNPDFSAAVATWDDSSSTIKGLVKVSKANAPENFAQYQLTSLTDNAGWTELAVTHVTSNGSFVSGDALRVDFSRTGDAGLSGNDGGVRWTFDTATDTSVDPGAGDLRLNNAAMASVTEIGVSANNAEAGNPDISDFVATWDDSTTTSNRGMIQIVRGDANENFAIYQITGAITDNGTHLQIPVSHADSAGSFTNGSVLSVQFSRTGDTGGDTLPVDDTTSLVQDPVDGTKEMRIDVGAVTTSTVRTLTMPDQNVDLTPGNTFQAQDADLTAIAALANTDGNIIVGNGSTWVAESGPTALASLGIATIRKAATQSVSSSTALQNDDDLVCALAANETVVFEALILHVSNTTADFKFAFAVPAGAEIKYALPNAYEDASGNIASPAAVGQASGTEIVIGSGAATRALKINGIVRNAGNAGDLQFQWGQKASDPVNTQVVADSYMTVRTL